MQIVIDIPQGLKIDFENENWTALTCAEMKNALMRGTPLDGVLQEIRQEIAENGNSDINTQVVLHIIDKHIKEIEE